jgi:CBS domain-containing protein
MAITEIARKPISILKNSTVSDAIRMLLNTKISRLIVVENGKHVGIITEKDIGLFLFSETSIQGLDDIPITKIMKPIEFVNEEINHKDAAKIMIEKGISSLAIGEDGEVKGIITKSDLIKFVAENFSNKKIVDFMTHDYEFTHTAAPLYKVVRKMLERKISRIIVKNQNEEPVGIISFRDLFRISIELGSEEDYSGFNLSQNIRRGFLSEEGFGNISLARDVMTKGLITVKFNEDLADACNVLIENNVSGLVVLDGNDGISGIFSKTDVTRALASI